jgi:hypothetical protein
MTRVISMGGDFCLLRTMQRCFAVSQHRCGGLSRCCSLIDGTYLTQDGVNTLIKHLRVIAGLTLHGTPPTRWAGGECRSSAQDQQ